MSEIQSGCEKKKEKEKISASFAAAPHALIRGRVNDRGGCAALRTGCAASSPSAAAAAADAMSGPAAAGRSRPAEIQMCVTPSLAPPRAVAPTRPAAPQGGLDPVSKVKGFPVSLDAFYIPRPPTTTNPTNLEKNKTKLKEPKHTRLVHANITHTTPPPPSPPSSPSRSQFRDNVDWSVKCEIPPPPSAALSQNQSLET